MRLGVLRVATARGLVPVCRLMCAVRSTGRCPPLPLALPLDVEGGGCVALDLSLPRLYPPSCWCARGTSHNTCATRPQAAGYLATSRIAAARTFVASAPKMAKAPSPPSMPSEFTGKTTMSISKIAGSKKDAGVDKLHDYDGPIGFVSLSPSLSLTLSRSRARARSLSLSLSLSRARLHHVNAAYTECAGQRCWSAWLRV